MHIVIPHKTTQQKALDKVRDGLERGRAQIATHVTITKEEWEGATLNFEIDLQGKTISGTLAVGESDYVLNAKLPLLWRMFEGRIESEISNRAKDLL